MYHNWIHKGSLLQFTKHLGFRFWNFFCVHGKNQSKKSNLHKQCFCFLLCLLSTLLALTDNPLQRFSWALLPFSDFWSVTSHKLSILFFLFIYKRQSTQNHSLVTSQMCEIASDKELVIFIASAFPLHWKKPGQPEAEIFPDPPDKPTGAIRMMSDIHTSWVNSTTTAKISIKKVPNKQTKLIIICI